VVAHALAEQGDRLMPVDFDESVRPDLAAAVERALQDVLDPCSVFNGTRLSFVELGMIDAITMPTPGRVQVRLLLDDPVCLYVAKITDGLTAAILSVDGVDSVEIEHSAHDLWTEERATPATRALIARQRERRRDMVRARRALTSGKEVHHVDDQ
jgi:metal-sulfur cluster biosynthetic enzyme